MAHVARRQPAAAALPSEPPAIAPVPASPFKETFMVGLPGMPGMTAKFLIRHLFGCGGRQTTIFAAGKFHEWNPLDVEWRAVDEHAMRAAIYDAIKRYGKRPDKRHIAAVLHNLKYELTWPAAPRINVAG